MLSAHPLTRDPAPLAPMRPFPWLVHLAVLIALLLVSAGVAAAEPANVPLTPREARLIGGPTADRSPIRTHIGVWLFHNNNDFTNFNHGLEAVVEIAIPDQSFGFFLSWAGTFQADIGTTDIGDVYTGAKWQFLNDLEGLLVAAELTFGLPTGSDASRGLLNLPGVGDFLIDVTVPTTLKLFNELQIVGDVALAFNIGSGGDDAIFHGSVAAVVLIEDISILGGFDFRTNANPIDITIEVNWIEGVFGYIAIPLGDPRLFDFIFAIGYYFELM